MKVRLIYADTDHPYLTGHVICVVTETKADADKLKKLGRGISCSEREDQVAAARAINCDASGWTVMTVEQICEIWEQGEKMINVKTKELISKTDTRHKVILADREL